LLRKALFWDTAIETINWRKQSKAIIKRVFERGNEVEKMRSSDFTVKRKLKKL
jgi:hypothetical protein